MWRAPAVVLLRVSSNLQLPSIRTLSRTLSSCFPLPAVLSVTSAVCRANLPLNRLLGDCKQRFSRGKGSTKAPSPLLDGGFPLTSCCRTQHIPQRGVASTQTALTGQLSETVSIYLLTPHIQTKPQVLRISRYSRQEQMRCVWWYWNIDFEVNMCAAPAHSCSTLVVLV